MRKFLCMPPSTWAKLMAGMPDFTASAKRRSSALRFFATSSSTAGSTLAGGQASPATKGPVPSAGLKT